jgi:hypothetical protein
VIIHFEGAICHAIDPPAIQRALAVNAYNSPHGSHTVSLRLKAEDVNIAEARKLGKQSVIEKGGNLGILGDGKNLDTTLYFSYINLRAVEIGIENPAETDLKDKVYDDEVHLKKIDPGFVLDSTCDDDDPNPDIVAAYVRLAGRLTSCAAKHVGKFPGEALHDFAAGTTMRVKTEGRPRLFIRDYGSKTGHVVATTANTLEVTVSNAPTLSERDPVGNECLDREHFLVFYHLAGKMVGPIPCETAVPTKKKACSKVAIRYAGGVGCSNPGVP